MRRWFRLLAVKSVYGLIGRKVTTWQPASCIRWRREGGIWSDPKPSSRTYAVTPARQRSAKASAICSPIAPASKMYCA